MSLTRVWQASLPAIARFEIPALIAILTAGSIWHVSFAVNTRETLSVYNLGIDTRMYDQVAASLSQHVSASAVPIDQPPGFVVLVAMLYRLVGRAPLDWKLLFCGCVVLSTVLVWAMARRVAGPIEGLVAAALTMFSPMMHAFAVTLQYEVPTALLVTAALAVSLAAARAERLRATLWLATCAGLIAAATTLTREVFLFLGPLLSGIFFTQRPGLRRRTLAASALLIAFLAPIALWSGLRYDQTGRVVLISSKGALNFQIGHNPNADGRFHLLRQPIAAPAGVAFIRSHPWRTAWLAREKALLLWGVRRDPWNVPSALGLWLANALRHTVPFDWIAAGARGGLLLLATLAGTAVIFSRPALRQTLWAAPAILAGVTAVHVVFFGSHRFLVPVLPLAALVSAIAVGGAGRFVWRLWQGRFLLCLTAAWLVASQAFPLRPLVYSIPAHALEGIGVEDIPDAAATDGWSRVASRSVDSRVAVQMPYEWLPSGAFAIDVGVRPSSPVSGDTRVVAIRVTRSDGTRAIDQTIVEKDLPPCSGYTWATAMGVLRGGGPVMLEALTVGGTEVRFDTIRWRAGYRRFIDIPAPACDRPADSAGIARTTPAK